MSGDCTSFGWDPIEDEFFLRLSPGQDFRLELFLPPELGVWPAGTTARIEVAGLTWNAAVAGNELRWFQSAASVAGIENGTPYRIYLKAPAATSGYGPETNYLWFTGTVRRTPIRGS